MSTDQHHHQSQESDRRRLDDLCERIIERDETPDDLEDVCRALKRAVEEGRLDAT